MTGKLTPVRRLAWSVAIIVAACSADAESGSRAHTESPPQRWDSAGVLFIAPAERIAPTAPAAWRVQKDLSIGVLDGDPDYMFTHIVDVDADPSGRIYVLDRRAARVSVYTEEGRHLFSFGRPGRGPGEFSNDNPHGVRALDVTSTGQIFVFDPGNNRASLFTRAGELAGSFPLGIEHGEPADAAACPGGGYLLQRTSHAWDGLLRLDSAGRVVDTVFAFRTQPSAVGTAGRREALPHSGLWALTSECGIVSGSTNRFRIELRSPAGELQRVLVSDGPAPLTRQERERFLERLLDRWAEMFRARGESEDWIRDQLRGGEDAFTLPDVLPAFTGLDAGPGGTIWVRGVLPIDSMKAEIVWAPRPVSAFAAAEWDVFAATGERLGRITLPHDVEVTAVHDRHIYGIEEDSLGVQRAVRFRIEAPRE